VTLRLADVEEPPQIVFEVIDSGAGIEAGLLPRLFERGARGAGAADRSRHGLGLFIVRRAMDLQRGTAELVSTGPAGTTMRLTLPQAL
jgi:signal transduction histidine kinase